MNHLALALLTLLCALRPHPSDREEPPAERRPRLELAAEAIALASNGDRGLAAAIVVVAEDANAFARYVGEGRCRDGAPGSRCSGGSARGYFDLTRSACPELWEGPPERWEPVPDGAPPGWLEVGDIPERIAAGRWGVHQGARCAARALVVGFHRCGRSWPMAFKLYATGSCAAWPGQNRRTAKWTWMAARLRTSPPAKAIRDAIEDVCERYGCSTEVEVAAVDGLYSEPPGGFGGLTADQAAESLIEGARRP